MLAKLSPQFYINYCHNFILIIATNIRNSCCHQKFVAGQGKEKTKWGLSADDDENEWKNDWEQNILDQNYLTFNLYLLV